MESVEATGRNVDEALENALDELGLERDEVEVTVVSEGGLAGEARVVVTPRDDIEDFEEVGDELDEEEVDEQPRQHRVLAAARSDPEAVLAAAPEEARAVATLATDVLSEMLEYMDLPGEVSLDAAQLDDDLPSVQLSVHGEFGGILIGRHGETLAAIQFLTGLITGRRAGRRVRVVVDVEGYRERRARLLHDMAVRAADRAQRYRQPIFMDPMLPNERRIVHLALQDNPNVSTHSIGEGDSRRVVVSPRQAQRFGGYGVG